MDRANEKTMLEGNDSGLERRAAIRQRVFKGAVLSFNRGFSTFECVVKNLSDGGARLNLGDTFPVPSECTLRFADKVQRPVSVRWRSATGIGVQFIPVDQVERRS